jgi:hypothetical protein
MDTIIKLKSTNMTISFSPIKVVYQLQIHTDHVKVGPTRPYPAQE